MTSYPLYKCHLYFLISSGQITGMTNLNFPSKEFCPRTENFHPSMGHSELPSQFASGCHSQLLRNSADKICDRPTDGRTDGPTDGRMLRIAYVPPNSFGCRGTIREFKTPLHFNNFKSWESWLQLGLISLFLSCLVFEKKNFEKVLCLRRRFL